MNDEAKRAASPYSTGGGGTRFEHRLGTVLLVRLLTSGALLELGELAPERVAFQQSPSTKVDDLVVSATGPDGISQISVEIAARRKPRFIKSDATTTQLIAALVSEDISAELTSTPSISRRLAIAVSGRQPQAQEVAELTVTARSQSSANDFFDLIRTPGKFASKERLEHLLAMVSNSLVEMASDDAGSPEHRCWRLLQRLWIIQMDLEPSHEGDWTALVDELKPAARDHSHQASIALRDHLEQLSGTFSTNAAVLDVATLRRQLHGEIDLGAHTPPAGWDRLLALDQQARSTIARTIAGGGSKVLTIPRNTVRAALAKEIAGQNDLLVKGDSGVGKSALVMDAIEPEVLGDDQQAIVLNLRQLPSLQLELIDLLRSSPTELFHELTAPGRLLVIDAAEAAAEEHGEVFSLLLKSAKDAGLRVLAVATSEGAGAAKQFMNAATEAFSELVIPGLEDYELEDVAEAFPAIQRLVDNARARELLRRPIVIDLLGQAGSSELPLNESQALDHIWHHLVRNKDRHDQGAPDAREQVMLNLAAHAITNGSVDELLDRLDDDAVEGLRRTGMLLPPSRLPWERVPLFKHDLLRSYSAARWLLVERDPVSALNETGAPRWTLPSARLACEILLAAPDGVTHPLSGRFVELQNGFDQIALDRGKRWSDVPQEALLSIPNSGELIKDAWPLLTADRAEALGQLIRVARARHRHNGIIDPIAVEPLIARLLEDGAPREVTEAVDDLLRDWLRALIIGRVPVGQNTRIKLRESILDQSESRERKLDRDEAERKAKLASRSPGEIAADEKKQKQFAEIRSSLISGRYSRKREPERHRPYLWIDDSQIEQLALLGPDLGEEGEKILRRIAEDEPHSLDHAVESLLAGQSLASYNVDLLVDLAAAYYIDEEDDEDEGYGWSGRGPLDDGIRHHRFGGMGQPLYSFSHGPFVSLFRANYTGGIALLNRMLIHAARYRVQSLKDLPYPEAEENPGEFEQVLSISGEPRCYVGDGHVWLWYRGTGVGPYPCMSALQALEFVTEEFIRIGVATPQELCGLITLDAETLAMPALALGILVRHLEVVGDAIDPFLVEPAVWRFEFSRAISDQTSGLAAQIPGIPNPERRNWTLREVSMMLTMLGEGARLTKLKEIGNQLIQITREEIGEKPSSDARQHLAAVKTWAAALDRDAYEVKKQDGQIVIQQATDPEVQSELDETNEDLRRTNDAMGLVARHAHVRDHGGRAPETESDDLARDLELAKALLEKPPRTMAFDLDGPVAVAATAVELHFTSGATVSSEDLAWSASTLRQLAADMRSSGQAEYDESLFSQGADRSVGRALPFLLLPEAAELRETIGIQSTESIDELISLSQAIAVGGVKETRLAYARSLDAIWNAPCDTEHLSGSCHHQIALDLVTDSLIRSRVGPWSNEAQRRPVERLDPPKASSLDALEGEDIYVGRLTPALRALGSAALSPACCSGEASEALDSVLAAHQRAMLAHDHGYQHSDSDSLVAARAALWQTRRGQDETLLDYVRRYTVDSRMLAEGLGAINAAAEEFPESGQEARRLWPEIMDLVLDAAENDPQLFGAHMWGDYAESSLVPNPTGGWRYLTAERNGEPCQWRNLLIWSSQIERWLRTITHSRMSIDHMVVAVGELDPADQNVQGLQWIEKLVEQSDDRCASTFTLPEWLHERRTGLHSEQIDSWQRVVDFLVVAGDSRVADLAD